jgi:hypothetical protein
MSSRAIRYRAYALGAALMLGLAGCGGKGTEVDDARVIAEPGTTPSGGSTTTTSSANTATPASTSGAAAAPASTSGTSGGATAPAAVVKAEGWGTLKGRVVFDGDPPAQKVLVPKGDTGAKDAAVCAKNEIKAERLVVDPATKGLAAMTNQKIDLKSSDPVSHNINCKVQNNSFNEAIAPNGKAEKQPVAAARQPGVVTCDIHPWMTSYWLVLDNPYFAVTDDKGNFEIKNAPAGTQKVVVWQEATLFATPSQGQDVTIAANGDTAQDFTIKASQVRPEQ